MTGETDDMELLHTIELNTEFIDCLAQHRYNNGHSRDLSVINDAVQKAVQALIEAFAPYDKSDDESFNLLLKEAKLSDGR